MVCSSLSFSLSINITNQFFFIILGAPKYVNAGDDAVITSCSLPHSYSSKDSSYSVLWRGPDGNALLPGGSKYDMRVTSCHGLMDIAPSERESRKAELSITGCEWGKDGGDYTLSLVSTTSDDLSFHFSNTLIVRCKILQYLFILN